MDEATKLHLIGLAELLDEQFEQHQQREQHLAAWFTALIEVLQAKGYITANEVTNLIPRELARIDQNLAARAEEARR